MSIKRFLLYVCYLLIIVSCKDNKKVIKQTEVTFKKEGELTIIKSDSTTVHLNIEIADTDYDTQTGLMYRNSMADTQAMLFIFENEQPRSFYMKNTRIPLDIIFIGENKKIVSFQKNAQAFDETSLPSNSPAKYVLEVNAGLADKWQLKIGNTISYTH
ncbi:DUF192 domain-containing protein [Aestuariivivens sp. NBU2969]|uniref:DUF192 domain-containing protein n=1 Tax=Aestuariivivens sp. NBU2969 TaxID=2873267 RepID=UPI001CBB3AEA|nr:DUF192 domain-containing protein [Aestuariivivens sp. NBU2969]